MASAPKDPGAADRRRSPGSDDERGNEVEEAYCGVDGAPVLNLSRDAAKVRFEYDARGNAIATKRYDRRGQLSGKGPLPG